MSINSAASIGFLATNGGEIDQEIYHVGLSVPAGRRAFVLFQDISASENSYTIELITAANGFTGGTEGYYSPLREGDVEVVQSRAYGGVTPDGAISVHYQTFIDAGSTSGTNRSPASVLSDEILRSWVSSPIIRITRAAGGAPYRLAVNATIYEEAE